MASVSKRFHLPQQIGVLGPQGADLIEIVLQEVPVRRLVKARLGGGQVPAGLFQVPAQRLGLGGGRDFAIQSLLGRQGLPVISVYG